MKTLVEATLILNKQRFEWYVEYYTKICKNKDFLSNFWGFITRAILKLRFESRFLWLKFAERKWVASKRLQFWNISVSTMLCTAVQWTVSIVGNIYSLSVAFCFKGNRFEKWIHQMSHQTNVNDWMTQMAMVIEIAEFPCVQFMLTTLDRV